MIYLQEDHFQADCNTIILITSSLPIVGTTSARRGTQEAARREDSYAMDGDRRHRRRRVGHHVSLRRFRFGDGRRGALFDVGEVCRS